MTEMWQVVGKDVKMKKFTTFVFFAVKKPSAGVNLL